MGVNLHNPAARRLYFPRDVALDKLGNLYIADAYNHRIRKVALDGVITTVAGFGGTGFAPTGYSGDGGPATGAKMFNVASVSVAPDGSLVIGDFGN
ncbi:MAG: hypothetical protein HQK86_13610, partial [Nitrospinae bacterium]|nr:hypothetical protein [Nitrospinota bacterium]